MESLVKQASLLDTVKAVLSGLIGVRRRADHERVRLKPLHVIVTALLLVAGFVLVLRAIVGLVVS